MPPRRKQAKKAHQEEAHLSYFQQYVAKLEEPGDRPPFYQYLGGGPPCPEDEGGCGFTASTVLETRDGFQRRICSVCSIRFKVPGMKVTKYKGEAPRRTY